MHHDNGITLPGKLFGIGVGPGDPALITVKAKEILVSVDTVFVPIAAIKRHSMAQNIVEGAGLRGLSFKELIFPMTRDRRELAGKWEESAASVVRVLNEGGNAAFVTLGDPFIYSTWSYLLRAVKKKFPDIAVETVPGISTMNAVSAVLNTPLVEGDQRLALMPLPRDLEEIESLAKHFDTLVFYKVAARLPALVKALKRSGLAGSSCFVSRVGLPEETVIKGVNAIPEGTVGYLSTVVVKGRRREEGEAL
jgi:precorrin-2/cobalt-factor-2 C20-methyltransferase